MMYIFEGIDCAGKDTLIEKLRDKYDLWKNRPIFNGFNAYDSNEFPKVQKYIKDKKEWQKAITLEIANFCKQTKYSVTVNRFVWSEIVYANALRGGVDSFYPEIILPMLEGIAKVIYLECPTKELRKRIQKSDKKKSNQVLHNLVRLEKEYHKLIETSKIPVISIDSTSDYLTNDESLLAIFNKIIIGE